MGVEGATSAPYCPETNGMVERVNGTLVRIIKKIVQNRPSLWDEYLPAALMAYCIIVHSCTGFSPFKMLYGCSPALPGHLAVIAPSSNPATYAKRLARLTKDLISIQTQALKTLQSLALNPMCVTLLTFPRFPLLLLVTVC